MMYVAALLVELVLRIAEIKNLVLGLDFVLCRFNSKAELTWSDYFTAEKTKYGFISLRKQNQMRFAEFKNIL